MDPIYFYDGDALADWRGDNRPRRQVQAQRRQRWSSELVQLLREADIATASGMTRAARRRRRADTDD